MTDGQIRYQQIAETQRHNLEMERLGAIDSNIKAREARVREQNVEIAQRKLPFEIANMQTERSLNVSRNAQLGQQMTVDAIWGTIQRGQQSSLNTLGIAGKIIGMLFS